MKLFYTSTRLHFAIAAALTCGCSSEVTQEELQGASAIEGASSSLYAEAAFAWWLMAGSDDKEEGVSRTVAPSVRATTLSGRIEGTLGECTTVDPLDDTVRLSLRECTVPGVGTVSGDFEIRFSNTNKGTDGMFLSSNESSWINGQTLRVNSFFESSMSAISLAFGTATEVLSPTSFGSRFSAELDCDAQSCDTDVNLRHSPKGCLSLSFAFPNASLAGEPATLTGQYARCVGSCPGSCDGMGGSCVVQAFGSTVYTVSFKGGATTGPPQEVGVQCGER